MVLKTFVLKSAQAKEKLETALTVSFVPNSLDSGS